MPQSKPDSAPDAAPEPVTYRSLADFDSAFFPDPVPGFKGIVTDPRRLGALSARQAVERVLAEQALPTQQK